jgi:YegS/Rv2252/BmrU family lipid kinase
MMDVAVILNPRAGHGADEDLQREIVELLATYGREATIMAAGAKLGIRARAAVEAGCRVLVAAGGDGTVNAVASAVVGRETPLGVLPVGTLNHFAKDVGLPLDLPDAVRIVAQGAVRQVDVGEVNGRYFLNNSSIGVYPRIVEMRHQYESSGLSKWIAALWASLAVLRRRPFVDVRIHVSDEAVVRHTPFVFVGNNEYRMRGLGGVSRASLTGGQLAIYVMKASERLSLLRLGLEVMTRGVDQVPELDLFRVTESKVETRRRRLQVALDGEVRVLASPLEYRSRPGALRVLAP